MLARDRSSPHRYLLSAEELLAAGRAGEATEWTSIVLDIRGRHRAKRNLIKRLDEQGWARPAATGAVHS